MLIDASFSWNFSQLNDAAVLGWNTRQAAFVFLQDTEMWYRETHQHNYTAGKYIYSRTTKTGWTVFKTNSRRLIVYQWPFTFTFLSNPSFETKSTSSSCVVNSVHLNCACDLGLTVKTCWVKVLVVVFLGHGKLKISRWLSDLFSVNWHIFFCGNNLWRRPSPLQTVFSI